MPWQRINYFLIVIIVAGASAVPHAAPASRAPISAAPASASAAVPSSLAFSEVGSSGVAKHLDLTHPRVNAAFADLAAKPASAKLRAAIQSKPLTPIALARTPTPLQREVLGFVNASNLGDATVGYTTWNFSLLSTVAFFGLHVNSGDGALVQTDTGWAVYHSATMSAFVSAAHAAGTKVIVSINLHDFSIDPGNQICVGLQPDHAAVTISQTVAQVAAAGIDGINIDYEGTSSGCANGQGSRAELDSFAGNLRAAMPKGSLLVIDTYSGSAEDNLEFFDIAGLQPSVDAFFVMAYDMDASNWADPPLNCTSYCFSPVSPLNTYRFNATLSMTQYLKLVPPSKLILGQPYYGSRGCVPNLTDAHQYRIPNTNFVSTTYRFASTVATQTGVSNFAAHRDPTEGVAEWDTWYDSDWTCNREQYFDDVNSLGAKYDLVNSKDLRGVGLFTLDYGGGAPELWDELASKFTTTTAWTSLGGIATSGPDAASWSSTHLDAFVRGTDNGLWSNSWDGTTWKGWLPVGGGLASDPTAVSWGPNRVDVFVRGTDNQLWHKWEDGTTWYPWEPLGGSLSSGPDVASWSSNRLDVFARGTDSQLWHKWYDGAGWHNWEPLGGVLGSDPTAVSWGPNRIDVFVRGIDGQLWHRWWDSVGWRGWEALGGVLMSSPDAASCASGHLDVFTTGSDHGLWRKGFNNGWSQWQPLGGRFNSNSSATCLAGSPTVELFQRGVDYAVWQTSMPGT
jgi:spore germination protein YaaH